MSIPLLGAGFSGPAAGPETIPDLQVWWQAATLGLADAANPTPWNPKINNTVQAFSLIDTGVNASYDLTTLPVPSVDFTGSAGLDDLIRDSRVLLRGAGEGMMVGMTYQSTDVLNMSVWGVVGSGTSAFSVSSTAFRGCDFVNEATGEVNFRSKGNDAVRREAISSSPLVDDTPYVLMGVIDSDDSQHVWVNGLWHGSATQVQSIKHDSIDGEINMGTLLNGSTAWSPPSVISDYINYVRAGAITNAEVNKLGHYLARRIGATWTAVTDLAT